MADRSTFIGGSDARRIMAGEWLELWEEKTGIRQPADLSGIFRVQLGTYTEPLHAEWFARLTGLTVLDSAWVQHPEHAFMAGSVDRRIPLGTGYTFLEMKHSNSRARVRDSVQYYMPQLQHYLAVMGAPRCWFSVIPGNDEPEWCTVDALLEYQATLIEAENNFWWHVENRVAPEIMPVATLEAARKLAFAVPIDGMKTLDMEHNNAWTVAAARWLATRQAAKDNDAAAKELKGVVPKDCAEAFGRGVKIARNKKGVLVLRAVAGDDEAEEAA